MRLRQMATVARELDPVVEDICDVLGIEVCFNDPGVGAFGLHNALMPIGDTLLEVAVTKAVQETHQVAYDPVHIANQRYCRDNNNDAENHPQGVFTIVGNRIRKPEHRGEQYADTNADLQAVAVKFHIF